MFLIFVRSKKLYFQIRRKHSSKQNLFLTTNFFYCFSIEQPKALKDKLALENNDKRLQKPEKLFDGVIFSPECFSAFEDDIYTGLQGDGIVRITEKGLVPIVNFGKKPCGNCSNYTFI